MNMIKIIGLYGRANVGKTSTLNLLIDLLKVQTTGCAMAPPQALERKMIFTYKGFIIGIGTAGDTYEEVAANCDFFDANNCDIVFSATRTRGGSCRELNKLAHKHSLSTIWIKKIIVTTGFNVINLQQANDLLSMI